MVYIKDNQLSVGYNPEHGQAFFDLLNENKRYIHSYFFSVTRSMRNIEYNPDEIIENLGNVDTYNIPGNLLINHHNDNTDNFMYWVSIINRLKEKINLTAITVLYAWQAHLFKNIYPDMEIHLSVRFWNRKNPRLEENKPINLFNNEILKYGFDKSIDVINISGYNSYNDKELLSLIKSLGIKTKFIVNEGCIINRDDNYNDFLVDKKYCIGGTCNRYCDDVVEKYPWIMLSRINLYKEDADHYDILKISSRDISFELLKSMMDYWTSDERTSIIHDKNPIILDSDANYFIFLAYLQYRYNECKGKCSECMMCKRYYDLLRDK